MYLGLSNEDFRNATADATAKEAQTKTKPNQARKSAIENQSPLVRFLVKLLWMKF